MNNQIDFVLPALYDKFLSEMGEDGEFIEFLYYGLETKRT